MFNDDDTMELLFNVRDPNSERYCMEQNKAEELASKPCMCLDRSLGTTIYMDCSFFGYPTLNIYGIFRINVPQCSDRGLVLKAACCNCGGHITAILAGILLEDLGANVNNTNVGYWSRSRRFVCDYCQNTMGDITLDGRRVDVRFFSPSHLLPRFRASQRGGHSVVVTCSHCRTAHTIILR